MSNQMSPEQFYKMARRLNARLLSLEKLAENSTYKNVLNYAYKHAIRDIQAFNPTGKRFPTKMPENYQDYQKVVGAMRRFDKRPTSYMSKVKNIYGRRAKSFSKNVDGVDFTASDLMKLFETGLFHELSEEFGSKTAQKMIAVVERDANSILDAIKKGNNIIFTDEIYGERLNKFFSEHEDVTDMLYRYLHRD